MKIKNQASLDDIVYTVMLEDKKTYILPIVEGQIVEITLVEDDQGTCQREYKLRLINGEVITRSSDRVYTTWRDAKDFVDLLFKVRVNRLERELQYYREVLRWCDHQDKVKEPSSEKDSL